MQGKTELLNLSTPVSAGPDPRADALTGME